MGFWWRVGEIIYFLLVGWGTLLCGNRQFNGGDSHMNIANSVNMTQSSAEFSILKSASKQPERTCLTTAHENPGRITKLRLDTGQ
jgi:hypothetical protein